MQEADQHIPVLLKEVIEFASPLKGKRAIDCTFGFGGYTKAMLAEKAIVLGIDQDPSVAPFADKVSKEYKGFKFAKGNFEDLKQIAHREDFIPADVIVMDIGVSSMQIDNAERGFSFQKDGPLDMRMGDKGKSAFDVVNYYREEDLANVIYNYGGERKSRRIAARIIAERKKAKIDTTFKLADIVRSCVRKSFKNPIDPATRTFQAIRIEVNRELEVLKDALKSASEILPVGGKIIVVTFHSLEDRIVKHYFRELAEDKAFKILTKKPVCAGDEELDRNPRSRSAKLRVIEKVEEVA
ncbi:MAG: 16S rRNA (cytosine(1402)-N(4))-methyltransferase RsmH [Alphaproteobacteria bacterium]|nr:16S rRNA (cytosine(1402)-N(4))-methyltransferase RsmH [Alphaproteobacteria bacterium]OJV15070.1 MAG: 16S rRNA (cytosine(1402)-N(4))-methyltransferase [Alphaproteobacteria bacterium 33-17]